MATAMISLALRRPSLPQAVRRGPSNRLPPLRIAIPIVVAAWAVLFEAWRFVGTVSTQPGNNDFRVFYLAAEAGATWGWPHMYDPSKLELLNQTFGVVGSANIAPLYTYLNPPLLAWLIAIMTPLPFSLDLYLWTGLNVAAIAVASGLVFGRSRSAWTLAFLSSLALWPAAFAIERGQPELLLYALVVASWWCAQRGHQRWAGVLLGLASCIKPQDVILLPAVFFICGFRLTALWWLAATGVAVALFAAVLGPTGIGTYGGVMAWAASDPSFTAAPLLSPFGPRASLLVGQAVFAAIALIGVWLNRRSLRVALAIGIVGTLTSAVHLHEYDYVGLVVSAWLAIDGSMSLDDIVWIGTGIVSGQLPAIGIRAAILIWLPLSLGFLIMRGRWRGRLNPLAAFHPRGPNMTASFRSGQSES